LSQAASRANSKNDNVIDLRHRHPISLKITQRALLLKAMILLTFDLLFSKGFARATWQIYAYRYKHDIFTPGIRAGSKNLFSESF
jgi:hypothetical protein